MKPRNEKDTQRLPSLVAHIIAEIDKECPGRGSEIYWRAFDAWDKAGRETYGSFKSSTPRLDNIETLAQRVSEAI